jgi:hypothetical protein
VRVIEEERIVDPVVGAARPHRAVRWNASSAERFGLRRPAPAGASGANPSVELTWETPEGWVELAPASMRQANFLAGGDPRAECYLTLLPGEAGGLVANVNRWRSQMSLPPLDATEVASLPRAELFGGAAALLDLDGTWTGMGGAESAGAYHMLGLLHIGPEGSRFLKLIGPTDVVEAQRESFFALAVSFGSGGDPGDHGHTHDGHTHETTANNAQGGGIPTPDGWRRAPDRQFRDLNYFGGEGEETECFVSILGGDGGGLRANVDRWRTQLGLPPATDGDLAEIQSVPILGRSGEFVELASVDGAAAMLVTVCTLEGSSVYVKMTGPRRTVEQERDVFLAFCANLEMRQ